MVWHCTVSCWQASHVGSVVAWEDYCADAWYMRVAPSTDWDLEFDSDLESDSDSECCEAGSPRREAPRINAESPTREMPLIKVLK